jgi:hypothetical protein
MVIFVIVTNKTDKNSVLNLIQWMCEKSSTSNSTTQTIESQTKQTGLNIVNYALKVVNYEIANLIPPERYQSFRS